MHVAWLCVEDVRISNSSSAVHTKGYVTLQEKQLKQTSRVPNNFHDLSTVFIFMYF
jgi:hypothetical protein